MRIDHVIVARDAPNSGHSERREMRSYTTFQPGPTRSPNDIVKPQVIDYVPDPSQMLGDVHLHAWRAEPQIPQNV